MAWVVLGQGLVVLGWGMYRAWMARGWAVVWYVSCANRFVTCYMSYMLHVMGVVRKYARCYVSYAKHMLQVM